MEKLLGRVFTNGHGLPKWHLPGQGLQWIPHSVCWISGWGKRGVGTESPAPSTSEVGRQNFGFGVLGSGFWVLGSGLKEKQP
ncbi:hypothetical protein DMA11_07605 [Marinilabiliaceae bacterium JC017]|nr:hypothetical protein DMA11_07605 [Marinilabiliaceae bacterium JC017]